MAKKSGKSKVGGIPAVAPQGKKIVFDAEPAIEGDASDDEQQSTASGDEEEEQTQEVDSNEDEEMDSDDDAAPEAVGFAVDQRKAQAEADAEVA
jgi:hypothetical protein